MQSPYDDGRLFDGLIEFDDDVFNKTTMMNKSLGGEYLPKHFLMEIQNGDVALESIEVHLDGYANKSGQIEEVS